MLRRILHIDLFLSSEVHMYESGADACHMVRNITFWW